MTRWGDEAAAFCAGRPALRVHAQRGQERASPFPIDDLPRQVQRMVRLVAQHVKPVVGECYQNAMLATLILPDIQYVEGVAQGPANPSPVAHAWNEVSGYTVDLTRLAQVGHAYGRTTAIGGWVHYYGTTFDHQDVQRIVAQRADRMAPLAEIMVGLA